MIMNREDMVNGILGVPLMTLQMMEPDTLKLTQSYWYEGNVLYDLYQEGDIKKVKTHLMNGPWTDKELEFYLTQINYMEALINND
jgi:hypothetical protein